MSSQVSLQSNADIRNTASVTGQSTRDTNNVLTQEGIWSSVVTQQNTMAVNSIQSTAKFGQELKVS